MALYSISGASRQANVYRTGLHTAFQKVSSGDRLADASSGTRADLSISERFRGQILGFRENARTIQNWTSYVNTVDSFAQTAQDILTRMSEVSIKAGDATISQVDRERLSAEYNQLRSDIAQVAEQAGRGIKQTAAQTSVTWWDSTRQTLVNGSVGDGEQSTVEYAIGSGNKDSNAASYAFEGTAVAGGGPNNAPTSNDSGTFVTYINQTLVVPAATGVLANDTDVDQDTITASLVTGASNGTVTLNADGSFNYVPNTGFTGADSFTYLSNDGALDSAPATVTMQVLPAPGPVVNAPFGAETRANSYTSGAQDSSDMIMLPNSNFVMVWTSNGQDGSGDGVFARLFDAQGVPLGSEFQVNQDASQGQNQPRIAADANGNFVITWASKNQGGSIGDVIARRFDAAGVALGAEFTVNTTTSQNQTSPAIAMDSAGNFVVTWQSFNQDGNKDGVYAQRFDSSGTPLGGETLVNSTTTKDQFEPSIAMDASGDYVIVWTSDGQDGNKNGVFAQRYNAAGVAQGGEFQINTTTSNDQQSPSVAMDSSGNFIVTWASNGQDGSLDGVYARKYNAAGIPLTGEFQVNTTTSQDQDEPAVAVNASGEFVITWTSKNQDGSQDGVYAREYDPSGTPLTGEFLVNTTTNAAQSNASVAINELGNFVVAWDSNGQDGSGNGVYFQRFGVGNHAPLAQQDHYYVNQDGTLTISAGNGVLSNDWEREGNTMTATTGVGPWNGSLSFNADGSFNYTPDPGFTGIDTFTYRVNDGTQDSNFATVMITVTDPLAGGTPTSGAVGDYILTRDGSRVIYFAQDTVPAEGISAQQTVMNLDLSTNTLSSVDLLAPGTVGTTAGNREKPRVMTDDLGRVWVSGRYSSVVGSDYFVPALLNVNDTTLDYGWDSASGWRGGDDSNPNVKIHEDFTDFAVNLQQITFVDHASKSIVKQGINDPTQRVEGLNVDTFLADLAANHGLSDTGGQTFHAFSPDGQYAAFEMERTGTSQRVMVVLNTESEKWTQYDAGIGEDAILSVSFDRNNNLTWTNGTANAVMKARIEPGLQPKLTHVEIAHQLVKAGMADASLSVLGTGLSSDGGRLQESYDFSSNGGHEAQLRIDTGAINLVDLGISAGSIDTIEDAQESVQRIELAIDRVSRFRADLGGLQQRLGSIIASTQNAEAELTGYESGIRDVDTARETVSIVENQIGFDSVVSLLDRIKSYRASIVQTILG